MKRCYRSALRELVLYKKENRKFELEMAIKKIKSLSGHLLYTYNCSSAGRTPAKIEVLTEIFFAWILCL